MKLLKRIFSIFILTFILFTCTPNNETLFEPQEIHIVVYSEMEINVLNLVNEHRSDIGINKLNSLDIISNVADTHTQYMIQLNEVNHDNFPMRAQVLMEQTDANSVGEIVAYGFNTANGVVNGWLNSPAHRTIIENPNYTHFGISIKPNSLERNFFTHIFIRTK